MPRVLYLFQDCRRYSKLYLFPTCNQFICNPCRHSRLSGTFRVRYKIQSHSSSFHLLKIRKIPFHDITSKINLRYALRPSVDVCPKCFKRKLPEQFRYVRKSQTALCDFFRPALTLFCKPQAIFLVRYPSHTATLRTLRILRTLSQVLLQFRVL